MNALPEFLRSLAASSGFSLTILFDAYDRTLFLQGIAYTALLSVGSIVGKAPMPDCAGKKSMLMA